MYSRQERLRIAKAKLLAKSLDSPDASAIGLEIQKSVEVLLKTLDDGVSIDGLDKLLGDLKEVNSLREPIEDLQKAIEAVKTEFPREVSIKGIEDIVSLLKQPQKQNIQVDFPDKHFTEIVAKLNDLAVVVKESKTQTGQAPNDYIPVRRVRKVGNNYFFDDTLNGGGGGGGGVVTPPYSSDESSSIYSGSSPLEPKFAVLSASSSGNTEVVAAVPGKRIRVVSYVIISNGTVNAKFRSQTTGDITGLFYLIANSGAAPGYQPVGHFQTVAGEALDINLSGNIAVGGHLTYIEV